MTDNVHGESPVAGLLLAAGGGRRLGGRPKALLPYRGRPLVEHAARSLREGGCERVYVVLGAAADEVRSRAVLPGCVLVENPGWGSGMGSSLRAGLAALAAPAPPTLSAPSAPSALASPGPVPRAALVALVDQPGIGPAAMARVRAAYRSPGTLAAAAYAGVRGHPVLFGAEHWAGIAADATGDQGARGYLRSRARDIVLVECGDVAEAYDIDTVEDLSHLE
ncbi:nucleotidyltransferase family protein [Streptomyces sp. NBC_01498]|uniref:nucleotidyltransferase family protein n=1 Tax=Streptomyces sp. NBC_01498 TaxID=2975870 RepID=UPI002E7C0D6A|nr:nucleotidyltransferase family protein [Streptomyces sp. NBC_01498]WTL23839.1 nucleotidyltransferase family protein [Streptomyces sp. NBC_01498]